MTVVNVNPLYTPRELRHQLKDSGATAIVILENFAHTLQEVIGDTDIKHIVVSTMGDMLGVKGSHRQFRRSQCEETRAFVVTSRPCAIQASYCSRTRPSLLKRRMYAR